MKTVITILIWTTILYFPVISKLHAADGEAIYNKDCTGCHGTEVFTRPDRRINNRADLQNRVRQCSYATGTQWFDEEIIAVTDFLDKNFYKF